MYVIKKVMSFDWISPLPHYKNEHFTFLEPELQDKEFQLEHQRYGIIQFSDSRTCVFSSSYLKVNVESTH